VGATADGLCWAFASQNAATASILNARTKMLIDFIDEVNVGATGI
jgi:hypothetical protein